jgi:hypothetical protein
MNTSNNSINQVSVENTHLLFTKKNIHTAKNGMIDMKNDYHYVKIYNTYDFSKQTYYFNISIDDKIYLRVSE